MILSNELRDKVVKELRLIADKMKKTEDVQKKMYWFSGAFGIIQRVYNFEFNPTLVFVYQVLNLSYMTINSRVNSLISGSERIIPIPDRFFINLENNLELLANEIESENVQGIYKTLENLALLAFITTGNGYYLYETRNIPIK